MDGSSSAAAQQDRPRLSSSSRSSSVGTVRRQRSQPSASPCLSAHDDEDDASGGSPHGSYSTRLERLLADDDDEGDRAPAQGGGRGLRLAPTGEGSEDEEEDEDDEAEFVYRGEDGLDPSLAAERLARWTAPDEDDGPRGYDDRLRALLSEDGSDGAQVSLEGASSTRAVPATAITQLKQGASDGRTTLLPPPPHGSDRSRRQQGVKMSRVAKTRSWDGVGLSRTFRRRSRSSSLPALRCQAACRLCPRSLVGQPSYVRTQQIDPPPPWRS